MENKKNKDTPTEKAIDVMVDFYKLDEEGQKNALRSILWNEFAEYITYYFNSRKHSDGTPLSDEERKEYLIRTTKGAKESLDSLLDILYGDDVELRCRIINKFIVNFEHVAGVEKQQICNYDHDYTIWGTVEGEIPVYDEDGDIEDHVWGTYFIRKCKYCGLTQVAYSEEQKEYFEEDAKKWAKIFPKRLIYTPKKNTEN